MFYAYCMRRLETPTVIITKEGNIIAKAGEFTTEDVPGLEVDSVHSHRGGEPKYPSKLWDAGRPLDVVIKGEKQLISRGFRREPGTDMDCALPKEVLQRRKRLIKDRMKQEQS